MDVMRLNATAAAGAAVGDRDVARGQEKSSRDRIVEKVREAPPSRVSKMHVQAVLDRMIRNTRFQYDIKDKPGYFVVRIIDQDTDKIIREIPSPELQKVHDGIEQALGILFDEEI